MLSRRPIFQTSQRIVLLYPTSHRTLNLDTQSCKLSLIIWGNEDGRGLHASIWRMNTWSSVVWYVTLSSCHKLSRQISRICLTNPKNLKRTKTQSLSYMIYLPHCSRLEGTFAMCSVGESGQQKDYTDHFQGHCGDNSYCIALDCPKGNNWPQLIYYNILILHGTMGKFDILWQSL